MATKKCATCGVVTPLTAFHAKPNTPDRLAYSCKLCVRVYNKARYASRDIAERQRVSSVRSQYGIEWETVVHMHAGQGGGCAICARAVSLNLALTGAKAKSIRIDHCHATGKVRGLLCDWCNVGLGRFFDNPELLTKAADYIRTSK